MTRIEVEIEVVMILGGVMKTLLESIISRVKPIRNKRPREPSKTSTAKTSTEEYQIFLTGMNQLVRLSCRLLIIVLSISCKTGMEIIKQLLQTRTKIRQNCKHGLLSMIATSILGI
jgi:hypothetical protein